MLLKTFFPPEYLYDDEQIEIEIKRVRKNNCCKLLLNIMNCFKFYKI